MDVLTVVFGPCVIDSYIRSCYSAVRDVFTANALQAPRA